MTFLQARWNTMRIGDWYLPFDPLSTRCLIIASDLQVATFLCFSLEIDTEIDGVRENASRTRLLLASEWRPCRCFTVRMSTDH